MSDGSAYTVGRRHQRGVDDMHIAARHRAARVPRIAAMVGSERPSMFAVVANEWRNVCRVALGSLTPLTIQPQALGKP